MRSSTVETVRHVGFHMGTAVSLHAIDAPDDAVDRFFDEIRRLETKLSRFLPDSDVMRLERGEISADDVSPEVGEVLVRCDSLRSMTGGAFDHRPVVDGRRRVDPNAFAKGWIIEQAVMQLLLAGVTSYHVNAGGDIALGAPPAGEAAWRTGISHPDDPTAVFARVDLAEGAIATSGRSERGDHIRGTRTSGCNQLTSVSVVGPELATADALATAVFASGEARPAWWSHESPYGIIALDASGRVRFTENLTSKVHVGREVHPVGSR